MSSPGHGAPPGVTLNFLLHLRAHRCNPQKLRPGGLRWNLGTIETWKEQPSSRKRQNKSSAELTKVIAQDLVNNH